MNSISNDWDLLQAWVDQRSERAFTELVQCHINMVYGAALRQVRRPDLAQDITQAVFLALARKAPSINRKTVLSGWLFRTTCYISARAIRAEARRKHWENEASTMNFENPSPGANRDLYSDVEPHLDAALAALSLSDRDALLVRYFERQPVRAVADRLGLSDAAARKRLSRAIDRLRNILSKRGVTLSTAALGAFLAELPVEAAPSGAIHGIVSAATQGTAPAAVQSHLNSGLEALAWQRARELFPMAAAALIFVMTGIVWNTRERPAIVVSPAPIAALVAPTESAPALAASEAPIPGPSRLLLTVLSAEDNRPLEAVITAFDRPGFGVSTRVELATNPDGTVDIPVNPDLQSHLSVYVSAPNHVPLFLRWRGHEFVRPLLTHTVHLERGSRLTGIVQTTNGVPISHAKISFSGPGHQLGNRENIAFDSRNTVYSDEKGRFTTDQMPVPIGNATFSYHVEHSDYVRERVDVRSPEALGSNHVVVMKPGFKIAGRVVDNFGNPVPWATVVEDHNFADPKVKSEANARGEFVLGPFSPGRMTIQGNAAGFQESGLAVEVSAKATNLVLQLDLPSGEKSDWQRGMDEGVIVHVKGAVVDAESGRPIPRFRVILNEHRGTFPELLGEGVDGKFQWPVLMAFFRKFSLQVEADGYQAMETDSRPVKSGTLEFNIQLQPSSSIAGVVVSPDGMPLRGVFVGLNGIGYGWSVRGTSADTGNSAPQTITDANGRFEMNPRLNAETVLFVHDSGTALVSIDQVAKEPIVLQPWGAIEGLLLINGQPAANHDLHLSPAWPDILNSPPGISVQVRTSTDENGRFKFPIVPAGPIQISRSFSWKSDGADVFGESRNHLVNVPPGATAQVTVGAGTVGVKGRLQMSEPAVNDWSDDFQSLIQAQAVSPRRGTFEMGSTEMLKHNRELARFFVNTRSYYLEIDADGAFRIEDVAPGKYNLQFAFREGIKTTGRFTTPVEIPNTETHQLIDLGTITIPASAVGR